jgi:transcriptional regulator of acetoin/glycerol metabolism
LGKPISQIDDDVLDALKRYAWPGNIRELENVIERAVVLAEGESIALGDLPHELLQRRMTPTRGVGTRPSFEARPPRGNNRERVEEQIVVGADARATGTLDEVAERESLEDALRAASGNKAEAARLLGIPRSTLFSKLRKFRINKPR